MNKKRWLPILAAVVIVLVLGVTVTSRKGEPADSTPTPTLSVAVGETGPRIVKQSPIAGQRLSLLPTVDLTFDRDMDPDSTGIAWSMTDSTGADVPGKITWPDERTLRFIPLAPLQPAADYAGVITTAAFALDGSTPGADIYLSFRTVDALAVGEIFPADGTKDVDVESTIAVIFNRPVVTLSGTEDAGTLANPIRIVPAIAGHGEWVNTSVFIYTPDTSLISGTTYRVTVDAGLTDFTGEALAETFISNFTTRVPKISGVSLKDRQKNPVTDFDHALLDQAFMVSFLQPMNVESVAQALSLTEEKTGLAFPYQLSWNDKKTILTITPAGRYKPEESYHLFLAEWIAEAEGGVPLSEGLDFLFHTVPLPRILGVTPSPNSTAAKFNSGLRIQFSTPMDFNSLKGRVVITPVPAEPLRWAYDSGNWIYSANGLEPGTQYEVRVLPGMRDIYGHIMTEGYSYSFRTADLNPYAMMLFPSAPLIYRADGPQKYFFFEYINLESSRISLYPLSLAEFFAVGIFEGPQKDILPSADPIRTWSPDLKAKKNTLARLKIPLQDDADQPLAPGYYYIGLNAEPFTEETRFHQGAVFVVATDNITFKASGNDALAWVTDLETGTPSGGIDLVLYDKDFKVIGRATTNADGLASWTGVADPFFVAAESGGHLAFASQAWGSGISQNEVGVWQLYFRDPESLYSFVYTDRPLYRPGQEVQFTGVVRSEDDLHYALPSVDAVFVSVIYEGEQIFKETLPLSEIGSFTGSYALGDDIPRGSYRIVIMDKPEGSIIGSVAFRVADYRKPEFQVGVTADTADISPGGKVVFDIRADYFSGGKVGNAAVDWFVEYTPYFFTPPSAFRGFSFIDWDMESGRRAAGGGGTVASGKGVMDSDGNFELPQTMSPGKTKGDWLVSFHANVTDVTGNLVSGGAQIVMHQSLVYAGIRATSYIGRAGEEQAFDLVVLDWEGQPVVGQTVSVQIVKRNWFSVQQMDEKGQLRWVTSVKETPVASFANVVMDADGRARASFIPNSGGVYKALVTVRDAKGNTHQASAYIWAAGDEYVPWQMTNDRSFQLVADKDSYEPGETAEILLAQPFEGEVYALVTYERGHIYHSEVVKLQGNSTVYRLPITADMAPAAYLSVVVIAGAQDRGTPDFRMGIVRINVNTTHQTLDVTVTADRETAGPGDTVTYTVETRDAAGNPLPAEVSWSLVDKAVLALTPSNVGPIVNAFYPLRALSVRTSLGIVWNAENFLASYKETSPTGESSGGGGDEGKGAGDLGVVSVRQDFKDTAFFRAETMTGADGKAQVTVTLPQNLTTWVMTVRAVTADSRVGEAVHELISSKPLFIALQTPRFFVAGDSARLGAGVHNNSDAAIKVVVSLQAAGVEIHSPIRQEVTVPGGQTAYVSWDVSVRPGAERVDLTARAEGGGFSDTSKPAAGTLSDQGIPVKRYTVRETVGTSGLLTDANSVTEGFSPPAEADHTELVVEVAPSLAASWASALSYLVDDPHCSMEQTVSRFLPNLLARRVLQSTPSASPALQADLDREVNSALQKIYAAQSYDGGWGWWSGWDSDPETSAYVMLGLIEAEKSGYAVSKTVLENGLDYLHRAFAGEVSANPDQQFTPQAFLLYVITRAGGRENDNPLYQYRYTLGVYEKAFFMMAMHEGNPGDPRIDTLLSDLESSATLSAAGIHWEEKTTAFRGWNTDRRTTAIVLQSMIQVDPGNPLNAMGVRWLMAGRSFGRWGSTQETAWSIMALAKWVETSRELEANYNYAIGLNGELWKDGVFDRFTISDPLRLTTPLESLYGKDGESLVLARGAGAGNLYYTAYMNISLPVAGVEALDHGIIIQREYFTLDNGMHPITAIGRGELVRVRLTIVASSSLRYVVVDDPLPAGLEAIDASLSGSVAVPRVYTVRDFRETGWGWWYFNHKEVRDDGVFLSASYLPAGTFVYTYLARASFAGTFNVIPATAEEFYFPDVSGHNAGSVFTVTP